MSRLFGFLMGLVGFLASCKFVHSVWTTHYERERRYPNSVVDRSVDWGFMACGAMLAILSLQMMWWEITGD